MVGLKNGLFSAKIMHKRVAPRAHQFVHSGYYIATEYQKLQQPFSAIFSKNKPNIFSLYDKNYGKRDGSDPLLWVQEVLKHYKATKADGIIECITMPRFLGYVFNPITLWLCYDKERQLRAVIAEVNNTFKDYHSYLIMHDDQAVIEKDTWFEAKKKLHVSPFFEVKGFYRFRFQIEANQIGIWINYHQQDEVTLYTSLTGKRSALSTKSLLWKALTIPFATFKVITLIHFHAMILWFKGLKYISPQPPNRKKHSR